MQRRSALPVLNKLCFHCKHEKWTDGSMDHVLVNRKERRIGCQSANKQVGNGFNHFSHNCVCLFSNLSIKRASWILKGERARRTWVKVVSMATVALKALFPAVPISPFSPAVMVSTLRPPQKISCKVITKGLHGGNLMHGERGAEMTTVTSYFWEWSTFTVSHASWEREGETKWSEA